MKKTHPVIPPNASAAVCIQTPGDHVVPISISVNYNLTKKPEPSAGADSRSRKVPEYRKFYLSYSIGGELEGKTEVFRHEVSVWSSTHNVMVTTPFLANVHAHPPIFTLWEIVRADTLPPNASPMHAPANIIARGGSKTVGAPGPRPSISHPRMPSPTLRPISLTNGGSITTFSTLGGFTNLHQASAMAPRGSASGQQLLQITLNQPDQSAIFHQTINIANTSQGVPEALSVLQKDPFSWLSLAPPDFLTSISKSALSRPVLGLLDPSTVQQQAVSDRPNPEWFKELPGPQPHHFDTVERTIALSRPNSPWLAKRRVPPHFALSDISVSNRPCSSHHGTLLPSPLATEIYRPMAALMTPSKEAARRIVTRVATPASPHHSASVSKTVGWAKDDDIPSTSVFSRRPQGKNRKGTKSDDQKKKAWREPRRHVPITTLQIKWDPLFLGQTSIETTLDTKRGCIDGIKNFKLTIRTGEKLLSVEQELALRPMSISVTQAEGMPAIPVPFQELDVKCSPVTARFSLFASPQVVFQTIKPTEARASTVYFQDSALLLPGLLGTDNLIDRLQHEPLKIEIHDRDTMIGGIIETGEYGVAEFDLSELTQGTTEVEMTASILPGPRLKHSRSGIPVGHWLATGAQLTIKISLLQPIKQRAKHGRLGTPGGVYGRVVIVAPSSAKAINAVRHIVNEVNASALGIACDGAKSLEAQLQEYRLSPVQRKDASLDLVCGYEIGDVSHRVLYLEGIATKGIKTLISTLSRSDFAIRIFNTPDQSFPTRQWTGLVPGLLRISLEPGLAEILGRAGTYLKGRTSHDCFEALGILNDIIHHHPIEEGGPVHVITPHITIRFPSSTHVDALVRAFGTVLGYGPDASGKEPDAGSWYKTGFPPRIPARAPYVQQWEVSKSDASNEKEDEEYYKDQDPGHYQHVVKMRTPTYNASLWAQMKQGILCARSRTQNCNEEYEEFLRNRFAEEFDFIKFNKTRHMRAPHFKRERAPHTGADVFNYSIQALSSCERQLSELRAAIAEDKDHIYAYGPVHILPPVDADSEKRNEEKANRAKFMTKEGFRVYKIKKPANVMQSNAVNTGDTFQERRVPLPSPGTAIRA
ncbi:hypothetical protein SeMB42_g05214 [Synchytrium endobioticum]|uniref:Uncharacterized protein n=1 Tax=Synchytrium endobioticum TaxID=286115 RepID=A0A507CSV7_9FUNG|nr:hypothetical protein SeLEV6574_g07041 [Synchytrium endobioticum]TPX42247.1 hypothetical protein SeMB42_g05214 [Synchytrium endobioticum]